MGGSTSVVESGVALVDARTHGVAKFHFDMRGLSLLSRDLVADVGDQGGEGAKPATSKCSAAAEWSAVHERDVLAVARVAYQVVNPSEDRGDGWLYSWHSGDAAANELMTKAVQNIAMGKLSEASAYLTDAGNIENSAETQTLVTRTKELAERESRNSVQ